MKKWYRDGLQFTCVACGNCCRGRDGYVWISEDEVAMLAPTQKLTVENFYRKFARQVCGQLALIDNEDGDCIFLTNNQCSVYEFRPRQCRTFPWWDSLLTSPEKWRENPNNCPGINHGKRHSAEEIDSVGNE
ncbi:zinc/iron-chelating domain-containing protein [Planctomycetales bacterium]|nr:zinc/iron-chelating domain-containing protein [Planctomycetales bacterium]